MRPGPELVRRVLVRNDVPGGKAFIASNRRQSLQDVQQQFAEPADLLFLHPRDHGMTVDDDDQPEPSLPGFTQCLGAYKLNIDRFDLVGTFVHVPIRLQLPGESVVNSRRTLRRSGKW